MNKERIGQNITFVSGDMKPDRSWFHHTKHALYHRVAERALNKSSLLCFDFCVKLRLCYSINDDVTLRFFWFKFTIFYRTRNDTNLMWHGVLAEFLFGICIVVSCPGLVVTWCVCRGFLFLFCSFLVNFTNLSWKEFNRILIILIYWVELYYYLHFVVVVLFMFFVFVWFLGWGWGGALAFMKKTGVWGSILLTIYVLVYYILFFHFLQLWLLSLNVMCCGL